MTGSGTYLEISPTLYTQLGIAVLLGALYTHALDDMHIHTHAEDTVSSPWPTVSHLVDVADATANGNNRHPANCERVTAAASESRWPYHFPAPSRASSMAHIPTKNPIARIADHHPCAL